MEVVRKIKDAELLMPVMALPETFRDRKLEVIVLPAEERTAPQKKSNGHRQDNPVVNRGCSIYGYVIVGTPGRKAAEI